MQCMFTDDKIEGKGSDPIRGDFTVTGEIGSTNTICKGFRLVNGRKKLINLNNFVIENDKIFGEGSDETEDFRYDGFIN